MIKTRKLDHVGLIVDDLESAVKWYQEILGFTIQAKFKSSYGMEFYYLENCDGVVYELYENKNLSPMERGKIDHMAYVSDDIEADYEYFKNMGCTFTTNGIGYLDFIWENGVYFFMIQSETGEIIEFCQKK
ncbi:MAG: VOC family protein [Peptostreptococcaceae bacterium]